jgi:hypothetical protein
VTESQTNKTTILRSSLKARELRAFEYLFEEDLNKLYRLHWDDPGLVFLTKPAASQIRHVRRSLQCHRRSRSR